MKIKRFFAKDMRSALVQVKEELGSDAVIMSTKKVTGGIEIVAAIDPNSQQGSFPTKAPRKIEEDKVSVGKGSMTRRFANMIKQYGSNSGSTAQESEPAKAEREEDSLAALLKRQSKFQGQPSNSYQSMTSQTPKLDTSGMTRAIQSNPNLAHLISDEPMKQQNKPVQPRLDPSRYEKGRRTTQESNEDLEHMRSEMSSIRRLLEHQVSGLMWQEVERREPLRAMLIKRLEKMGLSAELADQLACYIPEDTAPKDAWSALLKLLAEQIPTAKVDTLSRGGIVALLGPTGVGKTTTIAKLAARAAMEYGPDQVALVTTDTFRIGAQEQLAIYGRIMGCPVRIAKDADELSSVLYQLRNRRLILVDTAGMGQRDVRLTEQLDTLMENSGSEISSYLVMPATAQRRVLQETIDHFKRIPLSGCILSKIDESLSLGELISVTIENGLPIAYIANGQRVPEDIVLAQPKYLVAKANELLEKTTEKDPHFWNSEMPEADNL
ncbi:MULTISPECIES: flagellar biosynthesis protein FlhF [unclassified Aliivibrio]|uniref:flagellar biosynthesis protein FlhF n=1 Tax=unclassified Aliivibrio TaxID=2645654 RepID=UPI00080ED701|nr:MULTISPECIES: flagellar biosynthesis protein FlhF [unclassified Aliivibrio]OCH12861.1 flagellar biosynthesis protein FlhF [Aliivibrio sp. 1S165]OCH16266.1 flagellar biosynthesis protein FlhF [Aliivibrio sp. 1S128]OCH28450.1 flagellar biosynthesis protein FlhF [Aliivibrio sp. 1S175]